MTQLSKGELLCGLLLGFACQGYLGYEAYTIGSKMLVAVTGWHILALLLASASLGVFLGETFGNPKGLVPTPLRVIPLTCLGVVIVVLAWLASVQFPFITLSTMVGIDGFLFVVALSQLPSVQQEAVPKN